MSEKKNDGGPAFPRVNPEYCKNNDGMTLRDWFAGQALVGIAGRLMSPTEWNGDCIASAAYELADGMMEEREATDNEHGKVQF